MAQIISAAVARLKDQVHEFLSVTAVAQLADELGLAWRNTPLAVPQLVALFARQIMGGNLSMPELARLAGSAFTPEAYCTARGRLPLELLRELLRRVCVLSGRQVKHADAGASEKAGGLSPQGASPGQEAQAAGTIASPPLRPLRPDRPLDQAQEKAELDGTGGV